MEKSSDSINPANLDNKLGFKNKIGHKNQKKLNIISLPNH